MIDLVRGEKQLLPGRRCPRCLGVQWHIRRVMAYQGKAGDVILFSCCNCKRIIGMEVDKKEISEAKD
jgi:hypothetical protein